MSEFSTELQPEKRSLPLGYSFCSAIRKERAESELALPSDPEQINLSTEVNMSLNPDIQVAPLTQAEPPQWHVYRALVLYLCDNPEATKDLYFRHKLATAHDAYLNTFAAG